MHEWIDAGCKNENNFEKFFVVTRKLLIEMSHRAFRKLFHEKFIVIYKELKENQSLFSFLSNSRLGRQLEMDDINYRGFVRLCGGEWSP
jgi:hypothetical protein